MIQVKGVSKKFKIYPSPADRLKEKLLGRPYHHEYSALSNISFEVAPGETLGIIGENGAGKSTLLKILSGVLLPDTGTLKITGKVTGLLELGTGFNYELSGLQNIFMNGTFLGMTHQEIEAKIDIIIEFAELGDFINEPIKTYSSGMIMRLGFAIAIHANPGCFLVDEALSVGDAYFQQKCMRKIQEFKEKGGSIIFVSHDMSAVKVLCDSVVLLDHGNIVDLGSPKHVIDLYESIILQKMHTGDTKMTINVEKNELSNNLSLNSTNELNFISIKLLDQNDNEICFIKSGEEFKIKYSLISTRDLEEPHYGINIRNNYGLSIFQTNTYCMGIKNKPQFAGKCREICYQVKTPLAPGKYSITFGVANKGFGLGQFEEYLLRIFDVITFEIIKNDHDIIYSGVYNINPTVNVLDTDF